MAGRQPHDGIERDRALARVRAGLFGVAAHPQTLGRFVLLQRIGRGGLGVVYAAHDPQLDRRVAIKLLRGDNPQDGRRLLREAKAIARLAHPNVVAVHEIGQFDHARAPTDDAPDLPPSGCFVVMELVEGRDARAWLKERERPWRDVLDFFCAVGDGLAACHEVGIVHRDVKPSNIMVGADERPRVLDFGLARDVGDASGSSPTDRRPWGAEGITIDGSVVGTPAYMAPEQHRGDAPSVATDQFSFCVAVWEGLFGRRPFEGATLQELYDAKLRGPPSDAPRVPARVVAALRRGLSADAGDRYATTSALLSDLRAAARRRRAPAIAAIGGSVLVATIGYAAWPSAPTDPVCDAALAAIAGAWGPSHKDQVRAAFEAAGAPYAEDTLARLGDRLDAYRDRLAAQRRVVCTARISGAGHRPALDRRARCLERRTWELEESVAVLQQADAATAERAVTVVDGLIDTSLCTDDERLSVLGDQVDPLAAATVARQLAAGRARRLAGRFDEAAQRLREALQLADRHALARLGAETRLELGRTSAHRQDLALAQQQFLDGWAASERTGDGELAVTALVLLARALIDAGDDAQAERMLTVAEAKLERLGEQPELAAKLEVAHASIAMSRRDTTLAATHLRRALPLTERASGRRGSAYAGAVNDYAIALRLSGDFPGAVSRFEEAIRLIEAEVGPRHPALLPPLQNLAMTYGRVEEADAGIEAGKRARSLAEAVYGPAGPRRAKAAGALAEAYILAARYPAAADTVADSLQRGDTGPHEHRLRLLGANALLNAGRWDAVIDLLRDGVAAEPWPTASVVGQRRALLLATARLARGDIEGARAGFDKLATEDGAAPSIVAYARLGLGQVALRQGDTASAQTQLRAALALCADEDPRDAVQARVRWALSQALRESAPQEALRLAREAAPHFRESRSALDDAEALQAWLAARG